MDDSLMQIQQELVSGENIIWSGKPRGGIKFSALDLFAIPMGIFLAVIPLIGLSAAISAANAPPLILLIAVPFALVGFYLAFWRLWMDAKRRENTYYGVTNHRVIIISNYRGRNKNLLNIKTLPEQFIKEKRDGSGNIGFGISSFVVGAKIFNVRQMEFPCFEMVDNVRNISNVIEQAKQAAQDKN